MSVPKPSIDLEGHCSAVHDGTLYVLSPAGFQTLPLKKDAQWSEGASGQQAVTGPACVTAGEGSQAAFYVIGGTSDDDSYSGLQRYSFANQTWEPLSPPVGVMKGRTNHGVAYLKDSSSILVYAGSQPEAPSDLSSQTFTIDTNLPYNIEAYTSKAPPTNLPIMQSWNSSHALLVGGTQSNTAVYTFSPSDGWQKFKTELSAPLEISSRAILVDGGDGSKILNIYNMTSSPNTVTGVVLLDSDGKPAKTGQIAGQSSASSRNRRRDLTVDDWPTYNSTFAPTATRADCAVVQGDDNVAVIAAGSTDSPVALFNQAENSWVDADKFFSSEEQQPLQPSSTPSATPSATASATPSPAPGLSPHQRTLRTLGIVLGVLFGVAALFIILLLLLRWRKMKQKKQEGYIDEKQAGRMSFADRGVSFMKEAGGSVNELSAPNPRFDTANGSHSSLAIIAGKFGSKRNTNSLQPRASTESTRRLVKDRNGGSGMEGEPVEMVEMQGKGSSQSSHNDLAPPAAVYGSHLTEKDAVREERKHRSSGWSKYFATSHPAGHNGLSHLPSAYQKQNVNSMISDGSRYSRETEGAEPARIPSASFVPLDIDFDKTIDGHRMSHVTAHNPAFSDSREDLSRPGGVVPSLPEGQAGTIEDARRASSQSGRTMSSYNNRSTLSSNITNDYYNESGNTPWTPMSNSFKDHLVSRPPSSQYTASVYEPRAPSRGKSAGFFPGAGTSYRPSGKVKMSSSAAPSSEWAAPPSTKKTMTVPPVEQEPAQNGITIIKPTRPVETRDSTAMFGGPAVKATPPQQTPTVGTVTRPFETRDSTAMFGGPSFDGQQQAQPLMSNVLAPPRAAFANHSASDSRDSTVTIFPSGLESPKAAKSTLHPAQQSEVLAPPPSNIFGSRPPEDRDSTLTLFPRGVSSTYYDDREREKIAERSQENTTPVIEPQSGKVPSRYSVTQGKQPVVEDMSWLNLGLEGSNRK